MNHTCWSRGAILHSFLVCIVFYTSLHPTPVLLPGKSHGQKSLVGCSPWGREESDMTEQFPFHFSLSCIGEGSGNLLQCSCLENPKDGGDWWAAVYGVAQSRTRLKWLSSSSSKVNDEIISAVKTIMTISANENKLFQGNFGGVGCVQVILATIQIFEWLSILFW